MIRRVVAVIAVSLPAVPAARAQPARPPVLDSSFVAAFTGRWHCAGAFANGRPIESDVTFTPELDGRALLLRHDDRAPQRWRALGVWTADTAGTVRATLHDNGSASARAFTAAPWDGRALALVSAPVAGSPRRERFTYVAPARDSIGFAYEISPDGTRWALGDRLACRRR